MARLAWHEVLAILGLPGEAGEGPDIAGVATLEDAGRDRLAFAENRSLLPRVEVSAAAAILVPPDFPELPRRRLLRVARPREGFLRLAERFVEYPGCDGIHPDASVHVDAELGAGVSVGACAVIAAGARVGAGSCIGPGAFVGEGVQLGAGCRVEANASLLPGSRLGDRVIVHANAAIGADGFGFLWLGDHHHKVPQLGGVEIGDDVEIGCNTCVDRATLGVTRIGRGSKIDNQVQVAHNCDIGEHVILVSQVGLSGSVHIGSAAVLGGKVGVVDHVVIGPGARVGGRSTVTKDVEAGATVVGYPARPQGRAWREQGAVARLPETLKQVKALQRELEALRRRIAELEAMQTR